MSRHGRRVDGGRFYWIDGRGNLHDAAPGPADVWICRRLADFPEGRIPTGGATATCTRCAAVIVFNPLHAPPVTVPASKVCMQCLSIEPIGRVI